MSLQNRLKHAQAGNFVGREEQLDIFRKNISSEIPIYPFLLISGQGGVGKSTLLKQFQALCNENYIPNALTDYTESTPSAAMNQLATSLEKGGNLLKTFRERHQKYLELKEVIQKEPNKPDALGQVFSRLAGKSVVVAGRTTPITSVALDLIGSEVVEEQVTAISNWLFEKLRHKDDVQLMLEPTKELTPLFVADINKLSRQKQVVLIIDTFEDTHTVLLPWLMAMFDGQYGDVSDHISFVFAGRSFNQHDWLPVAPLMVNCNLEPFTKQETTQYLKKHGVINATEVDDIYHLSGGLPVHVAMLGTSGQPSRASNPLLSKDLAQCQRPFIAKLRMLPLPTI
jgi:energy-coupling factor transporter ATP-binding protein EcfA2